jgi:flagellar hook-basal body complex protein FliE
VRILVSPINPVDPIKPISSGGNQVTNTTGTDFKKILESAINKVNDTVNNAETLSNDFATGKTSDIHSVIIAAEKADIMLQLTTEVRNKIVEAYREIMRMQI